MNNEFLLSLSKQISDQIFALEMADKAENPDAATEIRATVQDRLQEIVIEINLEAEKGN